MTKNHEKMGNENLESTDVQNTLSHHLRKNTIIYEDKVYYVHPIYTDYGASNSGKVINRQTLKPSFGNKQHNNYLQVSVNSINRKQKTYQAHRFSF